MSASVMACKARGAAKIVVAVPVMPAERVPDFVGKSDQLAVVLAAKNFQAVGQFYEEFSQTTDQEVIQCMSAARDRISRLEKIRSQPAAFEGAGGESVDISEAVL